MRKCDLLCRNGDECDLRNKIGEGLSGRESDGGLLLYSLVERESGVLQHAAINTIMMNDESETVNNNACMFLFIYSDFSHVKEGFHLHV